MSSFEAFSSSKLVLVGCVLLGALASACSGGKSFTASEEPDASTGSSPDGAVVVVNPNETSMPDAAADGETDASGVTAEASTDVVVEAGTIDAAPPPPTCTTSQVLCGGQCVTIDTTNCGACGTSCPGITGGIATCLSSSSVYACGTKCNAGLSQCGSACTDLQSDASNCGRCGHGCSGAACQAGKCQSWVVTNTTAEAAALLGPKAGISAHYDMVTDGTNIVWIDTTQGVLQVSATGGASSPVVTLAAIAQSSTASANGLAIANGVVAWTIWDVNNGISIWTAKEGMNASGVKIASIPNTAADIPSGLVLDSTGTNAYFLDVENDYGKPTDPGIYKCDLVGKTCAVLSPVYQTTTFQIPGDVAISGTNVYWTETALDGIALFGYNTVVGSQTAAILAVDPTYLYWANFNLQTGNFDINRTPQSAPGTAQPLTTALGGGLLGMVTDGVNVYFAQGSLDHGGLLEYVPVDGSVPPASLKDGQEAYAVAAGGGNIYWLNGDNTMDGIAAP